MIVRYELENCLSSPVLGLHAPPQLSQFKCQIRKLDQLNMSRGAFCQMGKKPFSAKSAMSLV